MARATRRGGIDIEQYLPFVTGIARRMAASMPPSIDVGDLIQDGVLGLIDAAQRFEVDRGIKFETFAERRVRGAMIDALRRDAWPRSLRSQRRELEAARDGLRQELGHAPAMADLAARLGTDERHLRRAMLRVATFEAIASRAIGEHVDEASLPRVLLPSAPESPYAAYEQIETRDRVRTAMQTLPPRERRILERYYDEDVTMQQIGVEIGVNESRVSQLHARAIWKLRQVLGGHAVRERRLRPRTPAPPPTVSVPPAEDIRGLRAKDYRQLL